MTRIENKSEVKDLNGSFLNFRSDRTQYYKFKTILKVLLSIIIVTFWSISLLIIALLSLFKARRLYNEVIVKWLAQLILWIWRIKVIVHNLDDIPTGQVIYISNHSSSIDIFAILGLGLKNCRYFLLGSLRRIIPLGVIATLMGTFFTVSQKQMEKRVRIFKNSNKILDFTGESVYLSPEGKRVTTGEIGYFNKGAFHLATNLKVPIVPFYIKIPSQIDPGTGVDADPGIIHIYFGATIHTENWQLKDLLSNKDKVRALFVLYHNKYNSLT